MSNEILNTLLKQLVTAARSALSAAALPRTASMAFLAALSASNAHALGLGQVSVQSPLGQPLRATIPLVGADDARPLSRCFSARLSSADGAFITAPRIALTLGTGSANLTLSTSLPITEPALTLTVEMGCGEGMQRAFSLLLDPPMNPANTPLMPLEANNNRSTTVSLTGDGTATAAAADATPPIMQPKRRPAGAAAVPAAAQPRPVPLRENPAPARNVLRLNARGGSDAELINAIGLRLVRANSLAQRGTPAGTAAIPDLAKSAETRAAQTRFAALLRGDGKADVNAATTDQKLQDLQAKMLILENETRRLKQASQRDAAALSAARDAAPADVFGSNWISGLAALLILAAGAIAWLMIRIKRLKQHNMAWDWEKNVAAAGMDSENFPAADGHAKQESTPDLPIFTTQIAAPRETVVAAPVRTSSTPARGQVSARTAAPEFVAAEPTVLAAHSRTAHAVAFNAGHLVVSAGAAGESTKPTLALEKQEDLNFDEIEVAVPAVEEISDVMQEAEFWISLHDSQRAIEVLEPFVTVDRPTSPLPWLYLFELYADGNQRANYDTLYERFQRVFNGKIPTWEELEQQPPPVYLRSIEDMPHICDRIVALWSTEQSVPYLESLLLDNRDGNRIGFDLPVYRELMFLIGIATDIAQSKKVIKPTLGSPGWTIAA